VVETVDAHTGEFKTQELQEGLFTTDRNGEEILKDLVSDGHLEAVTCHYPAP
jgi:hypothetical protein